MQGFKYQQSSHGQSAIVIVMGYARSTLGLQNLGFHGTQPERGLMSTLRV